MSIHVLQRLLLITAFTACSRDAGPPRHDVPAASTASAEQPGGECRILSAADIKAMTGADVHLIARGASAGAGGTCGNYATADGNAYLGVNALSGSSEYDRAVAAVPEDVYPKRQLIPGLGDQALLMKDDTGLLRYLVARKGDRGVVLFPLGRAGRKLSDEQLRQLGDRALSRH